MEEKFALFYDDVIKATEDMKEIIDCLTDMEGASIFIGSGGSRVVAEFAAKVMAKVNKIITIVLDPSDLSSYDLTLFKNIFIASCGGRNYGVKNSFIDGKDIYLLSARKTKIKDEILLSYKMELRDSFISLNQTIVPMAVLLKYYLKDDFNKVIDKVFNNIDKNLYIDLCDLTNIYTNYDTVTTATFIESTLCESGISIPLIHHKYDYCHGRSTLNKERKSTSILLVNKEKDIDLVLEGALNETLTKVFKLKGIFDDEIVNEFYLTLQSMYLIKNIATSLGIDLTKIDYDRSVVRRLYYFKGSM